MMRTLSRTNLGRSNLTIQYKPRTNLPADWASHRARVRRELRDLGVSRLGLSKAESHYLPYIIHSDERLGGIVYGRRDGDFSMLVATDRRVIYLDKKPMFVNEDEVTYDVVSGVSIGHAGFGSTVILHTRVQDYVVRTFNHRCAENFVEYIESRRLERVKEAGYDMAA